MPQGNEGLVRETVENPYMKTKEKELLLNVTDELQEAQRWVLRNATDTKWDCGELRYEDLLLEIHRFVHVNFHWDNNPLPHLRRCFPDFSWRYYNLDREVPTPSDNHEEEEKRVITSILHSSNYIWFPIDEHSLMFAATRLKRWNHLTTTIGWSAPWFAEDYRDLVGEVFITDFRFTEIGKWAKSP